MLANRGRCVCGEVVEVMPLAQATVSQHLKILKEAGLVRGRIDGRNSCYCLDPDGVAGLREALDNLLGGPRPRPGRHRTRGRGGDDMRSEDEIRTLRERYGAIAQTAELLRPSSCGCGSPEMAPDGLDVIGDAYQGVAGRLEEADLHLGCGVPTRHAALRPGETVLDPARAPATTCSSPRHEVGPRAACSGWT